MKPCVGGGVSQIVTRDVTLELGDLVQGLHFRRHIGGVLEDAIGGAQIFRYQRVVVELERPPGAGQVVELAARDRFLDFPFGEQFQDEHQ